MEAIIKARTLHGELLPSGVIPTNIPDEAVRLFDFPEAGEKTLTLQVRGRRYSKPSGGTRRFKRAFLTAELQSDQVVELRDYLNLWLKKNGAGR